ncbi:hypothetical protein [Polaromonas vacuolata]|uniref:hypothetical protein n=1 Tax=Polaromonas vacuolata TaxID=37448 RepID=UPI001EE19B11|nr:hypothetical protein [Polaromonas vacuolata]
MSQLWLSGISDCLCMGVSSAHTGLVMLVFTGLALLLELFVLAAMPVLGLSSCARLGDVPVNNINSVKPKPSRACDRTVDKPPEVLS